MYNSESVKRVLVTYILIAANVVAYLLLDIVSGGPDTLDYYRYGAPTAYSVLKKGQYYRIIAGMFMHSDIQHLAGNMIMLYAIGTRLEKVVGKIRYSVIYFAGGFCGGMVAMMYYGHVGAEMMYTICIGASGAVFAVIGGMMYALIVHKGDIEGIYLRNVIIYILISIVYGLTTSGISLSAHIGGLIAGFVLAFLCYTGKRGYISI